MTNSVIAAWIDHGEVEALLEKVKASLPEEYPKIKSMVDTLRTMLECFQAKDVTIARLRKIIFGATSEATRELFKDHQESGEGEAGDKGSVETREPVKEKRKGHGRHGRAHYPGAQVHRVDHEHLKHGDCCPECKCGRVYEQKPGIFILLKGQAPIGAEAWESQRLRCNACGEVFTAKLPDGIGEEKFDATAGSMIATLKYGSGFPLHRLEKLQEILGVPLPASTMWEVLSKVAGLARPVLGELVRLAAQGDVLYTDDTGMRVLDLADVIAARKREATEDDEEAEAPVSERTGIFTTTIASEFEGHTIALFFTGRNHAGENMDVVLAGRDKDRNPPMEMCDALARNRPKHAEVILSNCLTHGRRQFVDVVENFPRECRFVIECLKGVYENEGDAKKRCHTKEERLALHQEKSAPIMDVLHEWLVWKLEARIVEPNSGLGKAIRYMLKRWDELTLFLRQAGAPLDNNLAERILKMVILHRKNALFYLTENGASVGDLFMSLIQTCRLSRADPVRYLTAIQRNAERARARPGEWLPWNYEAAIAGLEGAKAAS